MNAAPAILDPRENPMQVFLTDRWQLGTVLQTLLEYTGPGRLTTSTFGNGEEFLRKLVMLRKQGIVTHATLYCDSRAAEKNIRLHALLHAAYDDIRMCANHSKVTLIDGKFSVVMLGSQNQSRGNRLESYVILTDHDTIEQCRQALTNHPNAPL